MLRKKDLEAIPLPDPPEELTATAAADQLKERETTVYGLVHREKSYETRMYFSAVQAGEILAVQMWTRAQLAKGDCKPKAVIYIDPAGKRWISILTAERRWTESLIWNIYSCFCSQHWTYYKTRDVSAKEGAELCNRLLETEEDCIYKAVRSWQEKIREEKNAAAAARRKEDWDRAMALVPSVPEDFEKWVEDVGTIDDNFIFFRKGKRGGYDAFCTHCGRTFHTDQELRHNAGQKVRWNYRSKNHAYCPECGHIFDSKSQGAQKRLVTGSRVIVPQIAGEHILLRLFEVGKSFDKKGTGVFAQWEKKTQISETLRIFANRETFTSEDSFTWETVPNLDGKLMWRRKRESCYGGKARPLNIGSGKMYMANAKEIMAATGMPEIIYRRLAVADESVYVQTWLINMAKRKYIEYLLKSGLNRLGRYAMERELPVEDKDAKNLKELLGLDGQQLRILKDLDGGVDMVENLKILKAKNEKVDMETLCYMNSEGIRIQELETGKTGLTVQRAMNYMRKQAEKQHGKFHATCAEYRDYLNMARELGNDVTDEIISRTPDLRKMHDRYVEECARKREEKKKLAADAAFGNISANFRANSEHFKYGLKDLMIVTPSCASEIIKEGREQHHCVGASNTYMERMEHGESYILFLRKKAEPEKPYYTLEVTWDGQVKQSYGAYDRRPNAEKIDEWLMHFAREIGKRAEREKKQQETARTGGQLAAAAV